MDKTPWLTAQGVTSYDLNNMSRDAQKGLGWAVQSLLGSTGTVVDGFAGTQTTVPSLSINIASGHIYSLSNVDTNAIGTFLADTTQIMQQGFAAAQSVVLNTSGITAGQSQYWLIEVQFQQVDQVRVGDPTSGLRAFYNSANPASPLQGVNGLGGTIPTVRLGVANISAIAGTAATTGSNVPPSPSAGYTPLYLINLAYGQTTITTAQIQIAGPGVYSGYQVAPFLAGLLNSHHSGALGQAPQIKLGTEVQGTLPYANMQVSNASPPSVGGNITVGGIIPIISQGTVNPNSNVAGNVNDVFWYTTTGQMFVCTTTGSSSTAVWSPVGSSGPLVNYINSFPYTIALTYATYLFDVSAGSGTATMPAASAAVNGQINIVKIDTSANQLTLNPNGTDKFIVGSAQKTSLILSNTDQTFTMQPYTRSGSGYWVVI